MHSEVSAQGMLQHFRYIYVLKPKREWILASDTPGFGIWPKLPFIMALCYSLLPHPLTVLKSFDGAFCLLWNILQFLVTRVLQWGVATVGGARQYGVTNSCS